MRKINLLLICLLCFQAANAQWKKIPSGTFAWLHSVYFVNQKNGWIAGSNGTVLETTDSGTTWKARPKFTQDTIRDLYFIDENHGWLLAEKDSFASYGSSPSYILETFDGGNNWKRVSMEGEGKEKLVKIFFSKDGYGRAVGESGALFLMQADKTSWKKTSVPVRFLLLNGSFFNQNNGLVVGGGGTALYTEDGGNSWNPSAFSNKSTGKINSVFFTNQKIGWAVGAEGKIFTTANGGKTWRAQISSITTDLFDVYFINPAEGWAIGDNGVVLQTVTGGNIWTAATTNLKHKLERLFFVGKRGFAVGFGGTILKYEDGGLDKTDTKPTPVLQKKNYSAFS